MMSHKTLKIIKNRSDIGAGTRGSDLGIDALEIAAINREDDFFNRHLFVDVATHNESVYHKVRNSFAKRIGHVYEQCTRVAETVRQVVSEGYFPLVLSGDHSSALGTISGLKAANPERTLGVIWIDAHADLHSPYTSPSGNIHGMPLAAALAEDNRSCQINNLRDDTDSYWEAMKRIGVPTAKIKPEHLVFFGVRDTEIPENKLMDHQGIRNFTVPEVRFNGIETCLEKVAALLKDCDDLYISFDVDSLDCDLISHGTGTPVPKGFDPLEVQNLIKGLMNTGKVICLEIAEINPLLDNRGNRMAETAYGVLSDVMLHYEQKQPKKQTSFSTF